LWIDPVQDNECLASGVRPAPTEESLTEGRDGDARGFRRKVVQAIDRLLSAGAVDVRDDLGQALC
jgi:hypothetical protein